MINNELLSRLNACEEGFSEFKSKFPNGASYRQVFSFMGKDHSIWLIIAMVKNNICPKPIIEAIPIQCQEGNYRVFYRYLVKNWDCIKPALIAIKLDSL